MERHNATAMAVARFLQDHPRIERVHYPGLESHPDYVTAVAQMRGFGGVVSCEIAGNLQETSRFVDRLRMHSIAPSLGGVESMVVQPAIMSFYDMLPEERQAIGIRDNLVRLACGIEDPEDIIADLAQALEYS
jgi:cystathionine gamma-synthase